ncbi:MAG: ABC transporter ATP-binding protein [Clostridiales bacterium]|nr:ABC transporter ATP-binding protein [Clostridiales bacterium]
MGGVLQVDGVGQIYQAANGEIEAIKEISFEVEKGEFISVVGPSGCGKSTLLSIISGLYTPTVGSVYINGSKVCGISRETGYMLQNDNLLEWRSVLKNVYLGLEIRRMLTPEYKNYAKELLKNYGLYDFKDKYPSQLSGGMRQRAALIRTLAVRPEILLLDEAFSALDYQTRISLTDDVYKILKREKKTVVMVTHDISEAISMSDRVIVLTKRPACVKSIHNVSFPDNEDFPLQRRNNPDFRRYFNKIWGELDVHV